MDGGELMSTMADPLVGMILPRRYRILSLLGRGSMSVVYKGTYEPLDQLVAIKLLKSHLVSDPNQAKRFQQEIKTAGSLSHPNIVGILDFGVTDQGVPYLIMDYLEGKSLAEVLEAEERLSVNRMTRLFTQAANALAYAHSEGVIHRDIKPSNILLIDTEDEKDVVKIVDFGIAKIQNSGIGSGDNAQQTLGLTGTGEVVGTPLYMSPEQSQGKDLDGRADIYSLGCVMYHSITGNPPFIGESLMDTIRLQITATATPIELVRPDLFFPERLQLIITRALAKDPRMRYQRMEHLEQDLIAANRKNDLFPSSATSRTIRPEDIAPPPVPPARFKLHNLPFICAGLAAITVATVGIWGLVTDVGQKEAEIKLPIPIARDVVWRNAIAQGESALAEGRYDDAERFLKKSLVQARTFNKNDTSIIRTLNGLTKLYYDEDKLEEAEKACREALTTARALGQNDNFVADALANLSRIQCAKGEYSQAAASGKEALAIRQRELGPAHHEIGMSLQGLAEIECKRGDFDKAADILLKAQSIVEKALGEDNPEVASIVHNLGMVRERQGKYQVANGLYNRALGIRQRYLGTGHPLVSDTMCALGTLNFNLRKDANAELMFNNALDIRMKVFGEKSSKTAEVYACLAILYDTERKYLQAEECYRKAIEIRESLWGADSPKLLRSLQNLAKFLRQHNQRNSAEFYEAQIKRIQEKPTG